MFEKYFKYPVIVLYIAIFMVWFFAAYAERHLKLPEGCDEFGYLNMAKAVAKGHLFTSHSYRPFDSQLTKHLRQTTFDLRSYQHVICPEAYHFDPSSGKTINQYPPGTGILLSILPFETRKVAAPALYALLIVLLMIYAFKVRSGKISFINLNLLAVLMFLLFYQKGIFSAGSFTTINSYAPTYGFLLAAGYLLNKRPGVAILLLGASTFFRFVNVLFFLPFLFVYLYGNDGVRGYFSQGALLKTFRAVGLILFGGLGWYLLYVWVLLGNPLASTYSYIDQEVVSINDILGNIGFYFNFNKLWFKGHLTVIGFMVLLGIFRKMPVRWILFSVVLSLLNYGFYFLHKVKIEYYPYASMVIITGILLQYLEVYINKTKFRIVVNYIGVIILLSASIFSAVKFPRQDLIRVFNEQIQTYKDCFSEYDVVWAQLHSGTVEYATGKASFRYQWGPEQVRNDILVWLRNNGYRQAIWTSDLDSSYEDSVKNALKNIPLDYNIKTCAALGTVIEIR